MNYSRADAGRDWAAFIGLILLYPGFFFYHYAVAALGLFPFLGGYYGPMSAVLLPVLLLLRASELRRRAWQATGMDVAFISLLVLMLTWAAIYRWLGVGHQADPSLMGQTASTAVFWIVNYLLARRLNLSDVLLIRMLLASLVVMLIISLANQQGGFFYARRIADSVDQDKIATYQGFARSAFIVLLLLMAAVERRFLSLIYCLGLVLLFILGARSEFSVFLAVGLFYIYLRAGAIRFGVVALPVITVGLFALTALATSEAGDSRIFTLLNVMDGSPMESRAYLSGLAWKAILSSPILGEYGHHLLVGGIGSYAHNILSAWVSYGLAGFLLFAAMLMYPPVELIVSRRKIKHASAEAVGAVAFGLAMVILALFTKSVYYIVYPIGWALYASHRERSADVCSRATGR